MNDLHAPLGVDRDRPAADAGEGTTDIVVVCRANAARSPLVERLLRAALDAEAPGEHRVRSLGVRARAGEGMAAGARAVLDARGIPSSGHVATLATERSLAGADLVLTAEARHTDAVVRLRPGLLMKTFTVLEFAEVVQDAPDGLSTAELVRWASGRRPAVLLDDPRALDIADPVGPDAAARFADLERQLDEPVRAVVRALAGRR